MLTDFDAVLGVSEIALVAHAAGVTDVKGCAVAHEAWHPQFLVMLHVGPDERHMNGFRVEDVSQNFV